MTKTVFDFCIFVWFRFLFHCFFSFAYSHFSHYSHFPSSHFPIFTLTGSLPLNVTFKLPVSEISEIDDHKSVGPAIENRYLNSFFKNIRSEQRGFTKKSICFPLVFKIYLHCEDKDDFYYVGEVKLPLFPKFSRTI